MSRRPVRALLLLVAVATWLGATLGAVSPAAAGPADDEAHFVHLINQARAGAGVPPLAVHGELVDLGRSWAAAQAAAGAISHNPGLSGAVRTPWALLGENVGRGGSVGPIFDALMASPSHHANIVDPRFTHIGVGVVHTPEGTIYTSHQFMQLAEPLVAPAAAAPPPPPPPPAPAPPPPPPTTAPPTTTPSTVTATTPPTTTASTTLPEATPTSAEPSRRRDVPRSSTTEPPAPTTTATEATDGSDDALSVRVAAVGLAGAAPLLAGAVVRSIRRRRPAAARGEQADAR